MSRRSMPIEHARQIVDAVDICATKALSWKARALAAEATLKALSRRSPVANEVDPSPAEGEAMARRFHETYERLAPSFGYETRADTKAFDPESPNGKLMIAVCSELLTALRARDKDAVVEREG